MSFINFNLLLIPRKGNIRFKPRHISYPFNIQEIIAQTISIRDFFNRRNEFEFFRVKYRRERSKVPFTVFTSNFPTIPEYFRRFSSQRRRGTFRSLNSYTRIPVIQTPVPLCPLLPPSLLHVTRARPILFRRLSVACKRWCTCRAENSMGSSAVRYPL